jgi:hypothetical protein
MKKYALILSFLATSLSVQAAGGLRFNNFEDSGSTVNAPVFLDSIGDLNNGPFAPAGTVVTLMWSASTANMDPTTFQVALNDSNSSPITDVTESGFNEGLFFGGTPAIQGSSASTDVNIAIFAKDPVSGKEGYSNVITVNLGDPQNVATLPKLIGLTGWAISTPVVPEPSTIALGVVGGLLFMVRRRRS